VRDIQRYSPVGDGVAKTDINGMLVAYGEYRVLETHYDMAKAEVERLTKQVERLIVSLQKSHDEHGEALYKLKYKNERQTPRKKRSS
jgi:hypothetical protein